MKTIVLRGYGDPSCLLIEDHPVPEPAAGEITIDVAFAGVGFVDTLVRSGVFDFAKPPLTPGIEVSGSVREVGVGVTGLSPGQRVAALLTDFTDGGMGGYADVARAKAALAVVLQEEDDQALAAATIVNGATAFIACEGVETGATVAVSGASGGLGQCLIAAASHAGAGQIIAISGNAARIAMLEKLGATQVVSADELAAGHLPIDAAFDTVGGSTRQHLLRRLNAAGRLVLLGNASGENVSLPGDDIWLRSLKVEGISAGGLSPTMPGRIAAAGHRAIVNARTNPTAFAILDFDQVAEAHEMVETGQGPGKIVLRVA